MLGFYASAGSLSALGAVAELKSALASSFADRPLLSLFDLVRSELASSCERVHRAHRPLRTDDIR